MNISKRFLAGLLVLIMILSAGCAKPAVTKEITIAEQFGLAYAPLQIMKELKLLEKSQPGVTINWKQMGNTAAIREAMIAKEVDIGFMAIPPFLIGWDKGMEWKIAGGLSTSPVGLVTNRSGVASIKDLNENDRIALPQPGSVQHILLSMASERELGDSKKLDNMLVTMAHPDGMNALQAKKDITAHFTAPPYLSQELKDQDNRMILSGEQAMGGEFTFIVGVTSQSFYQDNPEGYKSFLKALDEAIAYIYNNKTEAVKILSKAYEMSEQEIEEYLDTEGVSYGTEVKGVKSFADFMQRNGYISKAPKDRKEIMWDEVNYEE